MNVIAPHFMQVTLPDCISERFDHSISAFLVSGQCVWIVVIGGLTELDSTRKLNPATELAAMCELGTLILVTVTIYIINFF